MCSKSTMCRRVKNIACQASPIASIHTVSQTLTTYLAAATLLLLLATPKAHQWHRVRQAWEKGWRQAQNMARDAEMEPLRHTHTHTSQPFSRACSVVNFWHAMQEQRQLFSEKTPRPSGKKRSSGCQRNQLACKLSIFILLQLALFLLLKRAHPCTKFSI